MSDNLIIRKINKDEINEANKIASLAFEFPYEEEEYLKNLQDLSIEKDSSKVVFEDKVNVYPLERWAAFTDKNEMTGVLAITPYQIYFEGNAYDMGAVGSVCTYPHHRRNGAISKCMIESIKEMYEKKYIFSYLYPFSEAYYRKFGFESTNGKTRWQFDLKAIPNYDYDGYFELFDGKDMKDILAVYNEYAKDYNMMIDRDSYDWKIFKDYDPYKTNKQVYIYYNSQNKPKGYFMFEREMNDGHRDLKCYEIVYVDADALSAMLSFTKVFKNDYRNFIFDTDRSVNLEYYCLDYAQSHSSRSIIQNGMVRVIDVKTVLENAKYRGNGKAIIKINDETIIENNGVWKVEFIDGKAVSCIKDDTLKPDVEMSIQAFSIAIIGVLDVHDFNFRQDIKVNNSDGLNQLFYIKPQFILNYF